MFFYSFHTGCPNIECHGMRSSDPLDILPGIASFLVVLMTCMVSILMHSKLIGIL